MVTTITRHAFGLPHGWRTVAPRGDDVVDGGLAASALLTVTTRVNFLDGTCFLNKCQLWWVGRVTAARERGGPNPRATVDDGWA